MTDPTAIPTGATPPSPPDLNFQSYHDVLSTRFHASYTHLLSTGQIRPFIYPWDALGASLLILYLLIPPTKSRFVYLLRYLLFAVVFAQAIDCILHCRSPLVTIGYGIGLLNAWAVLWCATLVFFNDARTGIARIEEVGKGEVWDGKASLDDKPESSHLSDRFSHSRMEMNGSLESRPPKQPQPSKSEGRDGAATPNDRKGGNEPVDGAGLRNRQEPRLRYGSREDKGLSNEESNDGSEHAERRLKAPAVTYRWQYLPTTLWHRLDWALDLVSSFRGPRWNHQISGMTPPPPYIQSQLRESSISPPTSYSSITRRQILRRRIPEFLTMVLFMDILKSTAMQDPYFWSLGRDTTSPFPYPALSRILISVAFTYVSLQTIFLLAPIVFVGILGPKRIGQHAWPWLYPPYFGHVRAISQKGLAGAWGQWWQQLFRFGFEQAGEAAARLFGGVDGDGESGGPGWSKKTRKGQVLRIVVAFTCSGGLHACASYTSLGPTRPLHSLGFFVVQPFGLIGQKAVSSWLREIGLREKLPWWLREAGNLMFVLLWFYVTGPLVADDFAAVGIWLYEPVPISPIRGVLGQGWYFWGGGWFSLYRSTRWWQNGLAF